MRKSTPKFSKATFTMKISSGVKKALEEVAYQDRRSLASLLEKISVDYLKAHEIPWTEEGISELQSITKNSTESKRNKKR